LKLNAIHQLEIYANDVTYYAETYIL